jgi:hypothetical protein
VGELVRVPAKRITKLRGIGSVPRYELVRRSREWRQRFKLPEAEVQDQTISAERAVVTPQGQAAPEPSAAVPLTEDLAHLSVDEVVRRLVPDSADLARVVGRAAADGASSRPVQPWADQHEIARRTGMTGRDADLADVLKEIIADEHVPYLAQLRYKGEGLLKRTLWERTWDLQREEDRTGQWLDIPVPARYTSADFLKNSYWRQRGKLDVPKERFISYPYASPYSDDSLLLGWAGWDHREQAYALITLIEERSTTDGWDVDRLKPLLAGLSEVMPWVRQWHGEIDKHSGTSPAEAYDTYLTSQREKYGLTEQDLHNWKPPQPTRGRRRA